jgi:hypothetical protein
LWQSNIDMLEFSKTTTLQTVTTAFYLLRNEWQSHSTADDRRVKFLNKKLVNQLDGKVWTSVTAVNLVAICLDKT